MEAQEAAGSTNPGSSLLMHRSRALWREDLKKEGTHCLKFPSTLSLPSLRWLAWAACLTLQ